MIREKRYLIFLLIVSAFVLFFFLTVEAAQLNFNDFLIATKKHGKGLRVVFIDYDTSVIYQLFRAENYTSYFWL